MKRFTVQYDKSKSSFALITIMFQGPTYTFTIIGYALAGV